MYYQALPDRTAWDPACAWGHAVSRDLVAWQERGLVLVPGAYEQGCWSGSVVADPGLGVRGFYTRVAGDDLAIGQVAVARCDGPERLISRADDVVIADPPGDLAVTAFRDPYVWRHAGGWRMIVGAALADGAGAVLHYRSADLERWRYTGVLQRGLIPGPDPASSQVWECPQLLELSGAWLLVVSVSADGSAGRVAACVGTYDGERFVGREWRRLVFGTAPYATSLFRDRQGRPCMISWLREDPDLGAGRRWVGAHSLVSTLAADRAGSIIAVPHPDVARSGLFAYEAQGDAAELKPGAPKHVRITCAGRRRELVINRPGCAPDRMPCGADRTIEVFVDADILEIFGGGIYGAWRLTSTGTSLG
jgi:beta-fructofuranosidase